MENEEAKEREYVGKANVWHRRELNQWNDSKEIIYKNKSKESK